MDIVRIRSISHTVARYLLFALLGLLLLDIVFETGSLLSFLSLAGVTGLVFLALGIDQMRQESGTASSQRDVTQWTWLGEYRWEMAILVGLVTVGLVLRVYA